MPHAWLVWIPGVHFYTSGAISDRYRTAVKGKEKSRRRVWLPLLRIAWVVLWIPAVKLLADGYVQHEEIVSIGASKIAANLIFAYALLDALVFIVPALILGIIETVLRWMVLYEIYDACKPGRSGVYLALSLIPVVCLITQPVLQLRCRDRGRTLPVAEEGR